MLRKRIHQTRQDLAYNYVNLLRFRWLRSGILARGHWDLVDSLTNSDYEAVRESVVQDEVLGREA